MTGVRWTPEQLEDVKNRRARQSLASVEMLRDQNPMRRPMSHVEHLDAEFAARQGAVTERRSPRAPEPNKTEKRYIDEVLWPALQAGEIVDFRFEAVNLRLGPQCHYRPDFLVVLVDGSLRFDEVKGGWAEEDAIVKFKTAVSLYPWFGWRLARYAKKQWSVEVWR